MNKQWMSRALPFALCALAAAFTPAAFAEDSQEETPQEERDFAEKLVPETDAQKRYREYAENLERRYPDSAKVDPERFVAEEGEAYALLYCQALGFEGACVVESKDGVDQFVAHQPAKAGAKAALMPWWYWLFPRLFSVGVIPDRNCPAGTEVWIHHDDEDRRNANGRGGWIGGTVSGGNTTWRFCRVPDKSTLAFRPLPKAGDHHDYAVLKLGVFCPSGARTVIRRQNNEIWNNQNNNSGAVSIFPSIQGWPNPMPIPVTGPFPFTVTQYCHFDGAAPSVLGHMSAFPNLGYAYGVHAPSNFPAPWALARGWVHQDDEDWFNQNANWGNWGLTWMVGGGNTWRSLARVR
ncbi:hypothetical protein [Pseudomonas sp. CGJS7]|uniref:hypothetical protein n=1 Tax=Pseudomonas sp. CGJS7 TaxID=3109348 RepID=UPI003008A326